MCFPLVDFAEEMGKPTHPLLQPKQIAAAPVIKATGQETSLSPLRPSTTGVHDLAKTGFEEYLSLMDMILGNATETEGKTERSVQESQGPVQSSEPNSKSCQVEGIRPHFSNVNTNPSVNDAREAIDMTPVSQEDISFTEPQAGKS